jgi:hypothetical protein
MLMTATKSREMKQLLQSLCTRRCLIASGFVKLHWVRNGETRLLPIEMLIHLRGWARGVGGHSIPMTTYTI